MPNHFSLSIANEFLNKNQNLTNMQLQKLTYIAHGWNLAINGESLVSDTPEAWDNGPVFRTMWNCLRNWGIAPIGELLSSENTGFFSIQGESEDTPYQADLTDGEKSIIDHVWRRYGRYNAFELSDMTHRPNTPWTKIYFSEGKNSPIPNDLIENHYRQIALAGRSPA